MLNLNKLKRIACTINEIKIGRILLESKISKMNNFKKPQPLFNEKQRTKYQTKQSYLVL